MLRLIHVPNALPVGFFPVDPTVEFEPGQIGGLRNLGAEVVCTISDGTTVPPLGIIDDWKTRALSRASMNEEVVITAADDGSGKSLVDAMGYLQNPSVIESSFVSTVPVVLNPVNGTITAPAGTPLNFDSNLDGKNDSIKVVCSYAYSVPDVPGDDTTAASGKVTLWVHRGIYQTDQFDTTVAYPLNATLFVTNDGKLTSRDTGSPGIAIVTGPPSSLVGQLQLMWL